MESWEPLNMTELDPTTVKDPNHSQATRTSDETFMDAVDTSHFVHYRLLLLRSCQIFKHFFKPIIKLEMIKREIQYPV